jgi:hypothetical protein
VTAPRTSWVIASLLVAACSSGGALPKSDAGGDGSSETGGGLASLRDSLAGAWSFDGDGTDHSGNGLHLSVTGLSFTTGRFGKGIQFAGDGTPIAQRGADDASLNLATGDFTVSFWVQFAKTATAQFVVMKGFQTGWYVGWAQTQWAYGLPAGGTFNDPNTTPTTGVFHHVVFTRAGGSVEMIVDETPIGTAPVGSTAVSGDPFQVGGFAAGGVMQPNGMKVVNGVVDDVAIWHRALTADERAYLATHAVP